MYVCAFACDYSAQWICKCEVRCRNSGIAKSAWITGERNSLFFFVVVRDQIHSQPRLFKVAGDLQACT